MGGGGGGGGGALGWESGKMSEQASQCMSIAVGSLWWRGHWTMRGVVSEGSQCGMGALGSSMRGRRIPHVS